MLVGDGCPCYGGEIKEAVRLARHVEPSNSRVTDDYVELKRADETATILRIVWRMLPRNGRNRCVEIQPGGKSGAERKA